MAITSASSRAAGADARRRHHEVTWLLGYAGCIGLALSAALVGFVRYPTTFPLGLVCLVLGAVLVVARPVLGLQLIAFLALVGDHEGVGSFPFNKNLSSKESMLFLSGGINFSPLEIWAGLIFVTWIVQTLTHRELTVRKGKLFWPVVAFTGFVLVGFVRGMASGGDRIAGLSEMRPLMYVGLLYVTTTNLFTRRDQYVRLYGMLMGGIVVNALLEYRYIHQLSPIARANPESILQHSTPLIMNLVAVVLIALRVFRGGSRLVRWSLLIALVPVAVVYIDVRRRAAIVGLLGGALILIAVLFWTNRRLFLRLVPIAIVAGTVYTAAFWNSQSVVGFPAQAVKTVIAPEKVNDRDRASNVYRYIETFDVKATIRANPLVGIGFGQPFYRPNPLPTIVDFALARYVAHNSFLWIWMKMGVGGFIAMLFLFGSAMRAGARNALRTPRGTYTALTVTSTAFILMYATYTYVDISWDTKSMVVLAFAFAQIDSVGLLPERTDDATRAAGTDTDTDVPAPDTDVPAPDTDVPAPDDLVVAGTAAAD